MLRWYEPVWLAFFMSAALKSTAVLALAWVLTRLLRSRPAAWRHLVWTAAAAAVLALPLLSVGLPELRVPIVLPGLTFHATAVNGPVAEDAQNSSASREAGVTPPQTPSSQWRADWPLYAMALWTFGALAGLLQIALATAAMARARRKARSYAGEDFSLLAAELGIEDPVAVLEGAAGSMPMTFGALRPAVFLRSEEHTSELQSH